MRIRYERSEVQDELARSARDNGLPVHVDEEGFIAVSSIDHARGLEDLKLKIEKRILIAPWSYLAKERERIAAKRRELDDRRVPYLAFECEHPTTGRAFGLAIRRYSSLPLDQRPWRRKS